MSSCESRPARVLLVEDDWLAVKILKYTLSKAGYEVRVANCGGAAGEDVLRYEPDAVILDLNLPDIPGTDVLRRIRATDGPRRRVVVILSARTYEEVPAGLEDADSLETKPIAPSTLLGRLARLDVPPRLFARPGLMGSDDARRG